MYNKPDYLKVKPIVKVALIVLILLMVATVVYSAVVYPTVMKRHYTASMSGIDVESRVKLRTDAILTTSYVLTDEARMSGYQSVSIYFNLTQGSLTSFQYRVQWSHNGVDWFDEVTETAVAGVVTDTVLAYTYVFTGTDDYYKPLPYGGAYIRLAVKGTGTVTSSACEVYVYGGY